MRREDLVGTEYERWLTAEDEYYWVLMDPTPGMDGLSEQIFEKNHPLEYAEDLWKTIFPTVRPIPCLEHTFQWLRQVKIRQLD